MTMIFYCLIVVIAETSYMFFFNCLKKTTSLQWEKKSKTTKDIVSQTHQKHLQNTKETLNH